MQDDRRLFNAIENVSFTALPYCHFSLQKQSTESSNQLRMPSNSNESKEKPSCRQALKAYSLRSPASLSYLVQEKIQTTSFLLMNP